MNTITIVGNGPIKQCYHDEINRGNYVIRFSNPPENHTGSSAKTDILFITNSKKQTKVFLSSEEYIQGQAFRSAKKIVLPYHRSIISEYMPKPNILSRLKGARADHTRLCIKAATVAGKPLEILSANLYLDVCLVLGFSSEELKKKFPSAGIMAIHYMMMNRPDAYIKIYGFSFQGWKRHDWAAEKSYIGNLISLGKAKLME